MCVSCTVTGTHAEKRRTQQKFPNYVTSTFHSEFCVSEKLHFSNIFSLYVFICILFFFLLGKVNDDDGDYRRNEANYIRRFFSCVYGILQLIIIVNVAIRHSLSLHSNKLSTCSRSVAVTTHTHIHQHS